MANARRFETIYDVDSRYHLAESDANSSMIPEHFGSRRIGVAIVGVGRMGAIHLFNTLREPRAKILYVLDASQERLAFMDKKHFLTDRSIKVIHTDLWEDVLNDRNVEAVIISTPTSTHEHYARSALEHNKSVLCEKPLADSTMAVKSLLEVAEGKSVKLICAFNRRYDPTFRQIAAQAHRGDIGKVRVIKTCSRNYPLPSMEYIKTSGGIFHDTLIHDVDIVLWLARELPIEVHVYAHAHSADYAALNDFDTLLVSMKFASGLMASIDMSRIGGAGYEQRMELHGPNGVLKVDEAPRVHWEKHTDIGCQQPSQCYSFVSRYSEAYANEIIDLLNHVEGHKTMEPIRPGYVPALYKILDACRKSGYTQQSVKLEWTEEEIRGALPLSSAPS